MKARILVGTLALALLVGAMATEVSAHAERENAVMQQLFGAGNPAGIGFRQAALAPVLGLSYSMNGLENMQAAAPDEGAPPPAPAPSGWFDDPIPFFEYHYGSNRDRRRGGLDTDLNGGTLGMTFRSIDDIVVGLMYDYTYGTGVGPGMVNNDMDTNSFTFFLSKNVDLLYFGSSFTFSDTNIRTRAGGAQRRTVVDANSFVFAPYMGVAAYQQGPVTAYSTLTMVWRWQQFNYNRNIVSDDSSDGTLVLMNRVDYAMSDQCIVTGIFDWNRVLQEEFTNIAPLEDPDHCWFSLGGKVRYRLSRNLELYAQYTADVGNESYENHAVNLGVSFSF